MSMFFWHNIHFPVWKCDEMWCGVVCKLDYTIFFGGGTFEGLF